MDQVQHFALLSLHSWQIPARGGIDRAARKRTVQHYQAQMILYEGLELLLMCGCRGQPGWGALALIKPADQTGRIKLPLQRSSARTAVAPDTEVDGASWAYTQLLGWDHHRVPLALLGVNALELHQFKNEKAIPHVRRVSQELNIISNILVHVSLT